MIEEKDDRPLWLRAWDDFDLEETIKWLEEQRKIHGPDYGRCTRPLRPVPMADMSKEELENEQIQTLGGLQDGPAGGATSDGEKG